MLVLSRRRRESIVIDGNVTLTVVEIFGNKVKIGIDAPSEVPVHRKEVADAISADNDDNRSSLDDHRLLVVSQDGQTRSTFADILGDEVGDLDTAESSALALHYATENEYAVAIIDESLDSESGQELFKRIKRCQGDVKGILCSDRPTVETVKTAIESGMDHVVEKTPVDQSELLSLVSS